MVMHIKLKSFPPQARYKIKYQMSEVCTCVCMCYGEGGGHVICLEAVCEDLIVETLILKYFRTVLILLPPNHSFVIEKKKKRQAEKKLSYGSGVPCAGLLQEHSWMII